VLRLTSAALAAGCGRLLAAEPPAAPGPRATSGDRLEPQWESRLTITVGPAKADLVGSDHRVIQAAVDYLAARGGGTVKILPGTYRLRNAVYLRSGVTLAGSGLDTVLRKEPMVATKLAADSDWFDQEVTLADASGFQLGDGVALRTRNPHTKGIEVARRTLVARSGKRFKLDRALRDNFWLAGETTVSALFPLLCCEEVGHVTIENLALDGNRAANDNFNGNYAGCIFCQDCSRITMRGVTARNYNGDGLSWQVCHDVLVENCHCHDNADLGLHPGSGSQRPLIRDNRLERNSIGLFFCWGVRFGLAEGNTIDDNKKFGISIGHRDSDNTVRKNTVRRSGTSGVLFRPERGQGYQPERVRLEQNRIEDSGNDEGVAVDLQGYANQITLAGNEILERRAPRKRIAIRLGRDTHDIRLVDNRIEGFASTVVDLRKPS
jgi:parallel beta-helix repeat protein